MRFQTIARPAVFVVLCCGVGATGWLFSKDAAGDWYLLLKKPPCTPPTWMFGIVWPVLYVLMGIAAGILWNKPTGRQAVASTLRLFLLHLILNGLWMPLFFKLHRIDLALIDITALCLVLCLLTIFFYVERKTAGLLLLPYLAWISFAVYLNAGIWLLNK